MPKKADFSGWATKTNIKCTDGRTIMKDAFADDDGRTVPLVYQHMHNDIENVLGHCVLENRDEGVYAYGYFNNSAKAQAAKERVAHKDITSLSIYANQLKQRGGDVLHGVIREVSLVLAGANYAAQIDNVMLAHGDSLDELEDEALIYHEDEGLVIEHSDETEEASNSEESAQEEADASIASEGDEMEHSDVQTDEAKTESGEDDGKTVKEVYEAMNEDQKAAVEYIAGLAVLQDREERNKEGNEAEHADSEGEELTMKYNAFAQNATKAEQVLSHSVQEAIIDRAKKCGSLQQAWNEAVEANEELKHAVYNDDGSQQTYGIANINYLFPEAKELNTPPEWIRRPDDWVSVMMNGVKHTPFSRVKTTFANITMDEARAKGYITGTQKATEVFNLLRRSVDPQTVYKMQKMDRDDIVDITDFDVIAWLKGEMRIMLDEEVARAGLIGDGREASDPYKIQESHIKPIYTDDDLFAIKVNVVAGTDRAATAKNAIRAFIKNRRKYKGSGNLTFFTSDDWLSEMLLLEDGIGHDLYTDVTALAKKLRVNRIVTVPQMEGLTRAVGNTEKELVGIAVDLRDYNYGTDRKGQVEFFDDFEIKFNQYEYLIETRLSGMLVKPFSAMVLEVGSTGVAYTEAEPASGANPASLGYFEKEGDIYRKSTDTEVKTGKTYYTRGAY